MIIIRRLKMYPPEPKPQDVFPNEFESVEPEWDEYEENWRDYNLPVDEDEVTGC